MEGRFSFDAAAVAFALRRRHPAIPCLQILASPAQSHPLVTFV